MDPRFAHGCVRCGHATSCPILNLAMFGVAHAATARSRASRRVGRRARDRSATNPRVPRAETGEARVAPPPGPPAERAGHRSREMRKNMVLMTRTRGSGDAPGRVDAECRYAVTPSCVSRSARDSAAGGRGGARWAGSSPRALGAYRRRLEGWARGGLPPCAQPTWRFAPRRRPMASGETKVEVLRAAPPPGRQAQHPRRHEQARAELGDETCDAKSDVCVLVYRSSGEALSVQKPG